MRQELLRPTCPCLPRPLPAPLGAPPGNHGVPSALEAGSFSVAERIITSLRCRLRRGGNSNVTLPLASITRCAENGLPTLLEMKFSKQIRPALPDQLPCTSAGSMAPAGVFRGPVNLEPARLQVQLRTSAQRYPASSVEHLAAALRTFPDHVSFPLRSTFTAGSLRSAPSFGLAFGFLTRGANSKAVPPSFTTRNASNFRCVLVRDESLQQIGSCSSVSSFVTCAGSMVCCKMILPVRNVQVLAGPVAFSQM